MNKTQVPRWKKDWQLKVFLAIVATAAGGKLLLESGGADLATGSVRTELAARAVFANCLNGQGAMMYGVDTCNFCLAQKKLFGDDFREIKYINCDFERELCRQKGISRLPAWEIQGKTFYGLQSFEQLSLQSGCAAPNQ
jgi:hypothetical protein